MAWEPLAGRLDKLPLVLAGPMLRQVTADQVTVWIATQRSVDITLKVYDLDRGVVRVPLLEAHRPTTAIGKNLHIVAVTARTVGKLAPGKIYFYDLEFKTIPAQEEWTLAQAITKQGKTPDIKRLTYKNYELPSFALPPNDLNKLRLIHGSCRKPHGGGKFAPDALELLSGLIRSSADDPDRRPHQLLLTGDQIYADEVADALLWAITDAGNTLLGWNPPESLPGVTTDGPYQASKLYPGDRSALLKKAGLTSDDTRSHLISLGEYLAMYLFAWSEELWRTLPTAAELNQLLPPGVTLNEAAGKAIGVQQPALNNYLNALPEVRRALANIPSYMMCDDHEVTDDWNMTRRFCGGVYNNKLGMRLIQNGLIAFALCQSWGNLPEQFADDPKKPPGLQLLRLLDSIGQLQQGNAGMYTASGEAFRKIVGLHTHVEMGAQVGSYRVYHEGGASIAINNVSMNDKSLCYHFSVEGPKHQVIVTDSRTWRSFPGSDLESHPDLISGDALLSQLELDVPPLGDRLLLVVFSTNVPPIPSFRVATGLLHSQKLVHENDLEDSWEFPQLEFDRLVKSLSDKIKRVGDTRKGAIVLLSGDVHFSFSSRLAYWAHTERFGDPRGHGEKAGIVFAQLVASSLKNEKEDTRGFQGEEGYRYHPSWYQGVLIPPNHAESYVGWNAFHGPLQVGKYGSAPVLATARRPTIATDMNSRDASSANEDGSVSEYVLSIPPHYRYRLDFLITSQTGQKAPPPIDRVDLSKLDSAARAHVAAGRAARQAKDQATKRPSCVGYNNLGEIEFVWLPEEKRVTHTLYWRQPGQPEPSSRYWARYNISLMIDDLVYPPLKVNRGDP